MSSVCLDTNAYSALMRGHEQVRTCLEHAAYVYLPATVLGELHAGFEQGSRRAKNLKALACFCHKPGVRIADVDAAVAERYGHLIKVLKDNATPIPTNDVWIAATAMELGARLLTYDGNFSFVPGLLVVAP